MGTPPEYLTEVKQAESTELTQPTLRGDNLDEAYANGTIHDARDMVRLEKKQEFRVCRSRNRSLKLLQPTLIPKETSVIRPC
jgi:hypothetical protein